MLIEIWVHLLSCSLWFVVVLGGRSRPCSWNDRNKTNGIHLSCIRLRQKPYTDSHSIIIFIVNITTNIPVSDAAAIAFDAIIDSSCRAEY